MRDSLGHFSLWGDFNPSEITGLLGLEPSAMYLKGEVLEGVDTPAKIATWDFYCPEELTLSQQLKFLLNALWPRVAVLQALATRYTADFNLSGEGTEVLEVKAEMLQQLAEMRVNLNCFCTDASDEHLSSGPAENKGTR